MGCNRNMFQNLSNWDVFWKNQVQRRQSSWKLASGRMVTRAIRFLVNASLSMLESYMRHCLCLF